MPAHGVRAALEYLQVLQRGFAFQCEAFFHALALDDQRGGTFEDRLLGSRDVVRSAEIISMDLRRATATEIITEADGL
jgi:hypothetical protein